MRRWTYNACMFRPLARLTLVFAAACALLLIVALTAGTATPTDEIAFDAPSAHGRDLYLMDVNRGRMVQLTMAGGRSAAWSKDGVTLAYLGGLDDGQEGLFLLQPGGDPRFITPLTVQGEPRALDWSPDGRSLVVTNTVDGVQSVFMLDLANGSRRRLTSSQGSAFAPAWSPQGLIAFSWSPVANAELYTLPASQFTLIDSHDTVPRPQRITDNMYTDTASTWSPDGQWIAFVSDRTGSSDVYLMRPDGSDLQPIRLTRDYEGDPSWAPDGQRLVIISNADGQRHLAILNLDGSDAAVLPTVPSGAPARPAWRPRS